MSRPPRVYEHAGIKQDIITWSKMLGIPRSTLQGRIRRGVPLSEAFGPESIVKEIAKSKIGENPMLYEYRGKKQTIEKWAAEWGVSEGEARFWFGCFQNRKKKIESLCWDCIHRMLNFKKGRGCSWAYDLTPVDGAEFIIKHTYHEDVTIITRCPKYKQEEDTKRC